MKVKQRSRINRHLTSSVRARFYFSLAVIPAISTPGQQISRVGQESSREDSFIAAASLKFNNLMDVGCLQCAVTSSVERLALPRQTLLSRWSVDSCFEPREDPLECPGHRAPDLGQAERNARAASALALGSMLIPASCRCRLPARYCLIEPEAYAVATDLQVGMSMAARQPANCIL